MTAAIEDKRTHLSVYVWTQLYPTLHGAYNHATQKLPPYHNTQNKSEGPDYAL